MANYTPIFSQIVDSSLWKEEKHVRLLFITMLVCRDFDHVCRVPDHRLPEKAKLDDKEVVQALKVLASPDRKCEIPQPFEGRRIQKVDGGWLILNGEHYQKMMQIYNKRVRWARNKKAQRARKKPVGVTAKEAAFVSAAERGDEAACDRIAEPKCAPVPDGEITKEQL